MPFSLTTEGFNQSSVDYSPVIQSEKTGVQILEGQ
jgi:hypothetical protein